MCVRASVFASIRAKLQKEGPFGAVKEKKKNKKKRCRAEEGFVVGKKHEIKHRMEEKNEKAGEVN